MAAKSFRQAGKRASQASRERTAAPRDGETPGKTTSTPQPEQPAGNPRGEDARKPPSKQTADPPTKPATPRRPGRRLTLHAVAEQLRLARPAAVPSLLPSTRYAPPITDLRRLNTSRLLPARYSDSVLTRIADSEADLQLIYALDNATNERLLAEANSRLGIAARELVFEVPYARIVNAAFAHPHPQGARFSTPYRGAWYAAFELATAKAEVLFHRSVQLTEIGWREQENLDYDHYQADFAGPFHDLRDTDLRDTDLRDLNLRDLNPGDPDLTDPDPRDPAPPGSPSRGARVRAMARGGLRLQASTLGPGGTRPNPGGTRADPTGARAAKLAHDARAARLACLDPASYIASQQLAVELLEAGALGIVYPSTRRPAGTCLACFRPAVVANVRKRDLHRLTWYPDRPPTFARIARAASTPLEAVSG